MSSFLPGQVTHRALRICLVTETFSPQVNGVSKALGELIKTIGKEGHEVFLLTPRYREGDPPEAGYGFRKDFPALSLPFYREILLPMATPGMVRRAFSSFDPDVLHIATEGTLGLSALKAAARAGVPVVTSYHTNFPEYLPHYRLGWLEPASWSYLRWFHNHARCTLVPTVEMRENLQSKGFENVDVWGRGVDTRGFSPSRRDEHLKRIMGIEPGELVFLYVGRLAPEKNLMTMVRAFASLDGTVPARLVLVGDGPLRKVLEKMGNPRIVLTGYKYGEELSRLYASGDVFLFPSLTDTFGNVTQEAMASGLPVIAFNVRGPRSIVRDFETGILVGEISEKALAAVMLDIARNGDLLFSLGQGALEFARSRNWDKVNSVCLKWYERVARFR